MIFEIINSNYRSLVLPNSLTALIVPKSHGEISLECSAPCEGDKVAASAVGVVSILELLCKYNTIH